MLRVKVEVSKGSNLRATRQCDSQLDESRQPHRHANHSIPGFDEDEKKVTRQCAEEDEYHDTVELEAMWRWLKEPKDLPAPPSSQASHSFTTPQISLKFQASISSLST